MNEPDRSVKEVEPSLKINYMLEPIEKTAELHY
jgi:hypothetical protein